MIRETQFPRPNRSDDLTPDAEYSIVYIRSIGADGINRFVGASGLRHGYPLYENGANNAVGGAQMIKCPKCSATLPDGSGYCQFCQATFVPLDPVRKPVEKEEINFAAMPPWVWPAYRGISIWWIVMGLYSVVSSLLTAGSAGPNVFVIAMGGISAIVGIGLLAQIDFIRKLVNICCFLQILQGALGLLAIIISPHITGIFGLIMLVIQFVNIVCAVLMIYLIGETESKAADY
jgi:hypothetical protein